MKRIFIILAGISMGFTGLAQNEPGKKESDTIRVGNMTIINTPGGHADHDDDDKNKNPDKGHNKKHYKKRTVSTNWAILDLGFTNYDDQTNYTQAAAIGFVEPGLGKSDFKLRTGKSSNVNIWIFMQRLNLIKGVVNLKYGLGVELNNYRYKQPLKFNTDPTRITKDLSTHYSKNKLAAEYATVPVMLNFNFTPHRRRGFGFSAGASVGYLYNSRQKTITDADGKQKEHDDFDLRPWKVSYIGEISLKYFKLYGSMATQSIFEKGLDQTPYSFGIRFSNW
jgi:hypothetical protein